MEKHNYTTNVKICVRAFVLCKFKSKRKSNLTAALSDQIKPCLLCDTCVESDVTLELLIKYFTVLSNLTQNMSVGGSWERICNQSCTKADKKSKYTESEKRWADKQKLLESNICYQYNVTILTKYLWLYIFFLTWYQLNIFECLFWSLELMPAGCDRQQLFKPKVSSAWFSFLTLTRSITDKTNNMLHSMWDATRNWDHKLFRKVFKEIMNQVRGRIVSHILFLQPDFFHCN